MPANRLLAPPPPAPANLPLATPAENLPLLVAPPVAERAAAVTSTVPAAGSPSPAAERGVILMVVLPLARLAATMCFVRAPDSARSVTKAAQRLRPQLKALDREVGRSLGIFCLRLHGFGSELVGPSGMMAVQIEAGKVQGPAGPKRRADRTHAHAAYLSLNRACALANLILSTARNRLSWLGGRRRALDHMPGRCGGHAVGLLDIVLLAANLLQAAGGKPRSWGEALTTK